MSNGKDTPPGDFHLSLDADLLEAAMASVEKHLNKKAPVEEPEDTPEELELEVDIDLDDGPSDSGLESVDIDLDEEDDEEEVTRKLPVANLRAMDQELADARDTLDALEQELDEERSARAAEQRKITELERLLKAKGEQLERSTMELKRTRERALRVSVRGKRVQEALEQLKLRSADQRARLEAQEELVGASRAELLRAEQDRKRSRARHARELEESRQFANDSMMKALLPTLDHLDLALEHADASSQRLVEGVQMIFKQLRSALATQGLSRVEDAPGTTFDPEHHEAISFTPHELPSGQIVVSHQTGYMLKDRLLRAARVTVSSGQPEPEPGSDRPDDAQPPAAEAGAEE